MKMKKKLIMIVTLGAMLTTSCNECITHDEVINLSNTNSMAKSRRPYSSLKSYSVNESLVRKYVNITSPEKTIQDISPIVRDINDTLAFLVQYSQGWELISGDTRVSPSLASSESGILDFAEFNDIGVSGINGLLDFVEQTKRSSNSLMNATWKFLLPQKIENNNNEIVPCGDVPGMWIPIDTQYVDNGRYTGHIISTHWTQDAPYNNVCATVNLGSPGNVKSFAGCGPIACGQVIYNYLKANNPNAIKIPATCVSGTLGKLIYSDFSTEQWKNLTPSNNSLSTFITYLGQEYMGAVYLPSIDTNMKVHREIGVSSDDCRNALDWAQLQYNQSSTFSWQDIVSSLLSSHPIIVTAYDASYENGHAFIIDALNKTDFRARITYEWKDNYHPDYWELQRNPAWMFETAIKPDFKGDGDIYEEEVILDNNVKIAMNWGYGSTYDKVFYLLRDGSTTISPSWRVQGTTYTIIDRLFYNIKQ